MFMSSNLRKVARGVALLVGLTTLAGGAAYAAGPGVSDTEIVIGAKAPLTGPVSTVGLNYKMAVELALKQINNKGGINGRMLRIIIEDDAGTPEGGVAAARRLIDRHSVLAIFDGGTSSSIPPVMPLYRKSEVPIYVSYSGDPRVIDPFDSKIFLGAGLPVTDWSLSFAKLLTQMKAQSAAIISCDQAHCPVTAKLLAEEFDRNKIKVVALEKYKVGDVDYTAQIEAIRKASPDVVVVVGYDGGALIPALRRGGVTAKIVGDVVHADLAVISRAGAAAEGMFAMWYGANQFLEDRTGAMGEWRAAWAKEYPNAPVGTPSLHAALSYSDIFVIAEAIRRAGKEVTRKEFISSVESIQNFIAGADDYWKGIAQPIGLPRSFAKDYHRGTRGSIFLLVKNGQFVPAPGWEVGR